MAEVIKHDVEERIFRIYVDGGEAGYVTYRTDDGEMQITHTVVDPKMRGQGLAKKLVDAACAYAEEGGMEIISHCSYARAVIGR
ncbi:MAG TPA: GNAT family N-acetyltransferase [Candidatus Methanomethylophilaceae archaeon]|jgi:predicted GNAT family acetyltransferase|nr:GNAT family N-acetyltransferase [Candidatus Methanomethylophilaceae archaeon]